VGASTCGWPSWKRLCADVHDKGNALVLAIGTISNGLADPGSRTGRAKLREGAQALRKLVDGDGLLDLALELIHATDAIASKGKLPAAEEKRLKKIATHDAARAKRDEAGGLQ